MVILKPSRLLAPALLCAALGFAQSANAVTTINIDSGIASLDCSLTCVGFTGGSLVPPTTGTTGLSADLYDVIGDLGNSNPTTERLAMSILSGVSVATLGTASKVITDDLTGFLTDAIYFALKIGNEHAFFENTSGFALSLDYSQSAGTGSGLSHITTWGVVPLPAALPMFIIALGGLFAVGRRRRGIAGAA